MKNILCSIIFLLSFRQVCFANYAASPPNEIFIADLPFLSEQGELTTIAKALPQKQTLILVPAYFSCDSSCPLLAELLKKRILTSQYRDQTSVLFLSFNPKDSQSSMNMFRKNHDLPLSWILGMMGDQSRAKDFFAQFQYSFQKTNFGFDHPNSAFIFSPQSWVWTGTLFGLDISTQEISTSFQNAALVNQSGVKAYLLRFKSKFEYLILFGIIGTLLPLPYLAWFFIQRKYVPLAKR